MSDIFNLSLQDFLVSLRKSKYFILAFGVAGLLGAIIYLYLAPNLYQATVQLQLDQIRGSNYEWQNLEDPNTQLSRIKSPSGLGEKYLSACQYLTPNEALKRVQVTLVKPSPPTVEINLKNRSPELALKCSQALIDEINSIQADLLGKKIIQYQEMLDYYYSRMNKLKKDHPRLPTSQTAFASIDEISAIDQITWLTNKILSLDSIIRFANEGKGRQISPIYVSPTPISPKRLIVLVAGILAGLLVGLFLGILQHTYLPRLKTLQQK